MALTSGYGPARLLTAQKPLERAYQRDPAAVELWTNETFPAIATEAKSSGAEILFWDESGFRADAVHGETWAPRGQTPVIERPGQRQSISAASVVSAKGAFWFATYQGGLTGEPFVELLKKLMYRRKKRLHLDDHSLYEILQILSLSMFENITINQLLTPPSKNSESDFASNQLALL